MREGYPEVGDRSDYIAAVIRGEEERFLRTLDQGIDLFERLAGDVTTTGGRVIGGIDAFRLYDTYGFPVDLTRIMAEEKGLAVDMAGFENAMEAQRSRAREASTFVSGSDDGEPWTETGVDAEGIGFVGYSETAVDARLVRWRKGDGGRIELVFDHTPFYALSGGQVGDTGVITPANRSFVLRVEDVHDFIGIGRVHFAAPKDGTFSAEALVSSPARLAIDIERRMSIRRNHSATHLLQAGLRSVLGTHVRQSGSAVDSERLRFDFNHFSGLAPEEIEEIERFVTLAVMGDHQVDCIETTLEKARAMGAMSLFEEKYGDVVRLVHMGDVSMELCGGTHVNRTGEIGPFRILSESSVAAGIRRIEATTGIPAYETIRGEHAAVSELSRIFNASPGDMAERAEALAAKVRDLEKQVRKLKAGGGAGSGSDILSGASKVSGITIACGRQDASDVDELKTLADSVRARIGSGVGILGAEIEGKVSIVVVVTDDIIATRSLKAGDIVKRLAAVLEGSGGGRPHMAMAGGKDRRNSTPRSRPLPALSGNSRKDESCPGIEPDRSISISSMCANGTGPDFWCFSTRPRHTRTHR